MAEGARITQVTVYGPVGEYGEVEAYARGQDMGKWGKVTEIRATTKSGMYADIPYVQVWCGDRLHAEFCQHNVQALYFDLGADE